MAETDAVSADGEAPAKKKTRRGSRGGRNRKKKPVVAGENGDAQLAEEAEAPAQVVAEEAPKPATVAATPAPLATEAVSDEYVPMSEWDDEI